MNSQKGLTVVELLISTAIASVVAATLLFISLNMMGEVMRARLTAELAIESQNLLRSIVEDTRLAGSLSSTNQNADANAPLGGWVTNDPSNILIIDLPAIDSSRNIIYNSTTGFPYDNEVVYYSSGSQMYRRVIADPAATGNSLRTTCPPAQATSNCPADRRFTNYLTDLTFTFYDDSNNTTADATQARSVQITVRVQRRVLGKTIKFDNTIRTTLRNR